MDVVFCVGCAAEGRQREATTTCRDIPPVDMVANSYPEDDAPRLPTNLLKKPKKDESGEYNVGLRSARPLWPHPPPLMQQQPEQIVGLCDTCAEEPQHAYLATICRLCTSLQPSGDGTRQGFDVFAAHVTDVHFAQTLLHGDPTEFRRVFDNKQFPELLLHLAARRGCWNLCHAALAQRFATHWPQKTLERAARNLVQPHREEDSSSDDSDDGDEDDGARDEFLKTLLAKMKQQPPAANDSDDSDVDSGNKDDVDGDVSTGEVKRDVDPVDAVIFKMEAEFVSDLTVVPDVPVPDIDYAPMYKYMRWITRALVNVEECDYYDAESCPNLKYAIVDCFSAYTLLPSTVEELVVMLGSTNGPYFPGDKTSQDASFTVQNHMDSMSNLKKLGWWGSKIGKLRRLALPPTLEELTLSGYKRDIMEAFPVLLNNLVRGGSVKRLFVHDQRLPTALMQQLFNHPIIAQLDVLGLDWTRGRKRRFFKVFNRSELERLHCKSTI